MADIKTHLRELGVAVSVYLLLRNQGEKLDKLSPKEFYELCSLALESQNILTTKTALRGRTFSVGEKKILNNSTELAKAILASFDIDKTDKIVWCGGDRQVKTPVDLMIGEYHFSLKEESFILENMGLYKYLKLMTGEEFKKGLHVFEKFAPDVYQSLFDFVWDLFIKAQENFRYVGVGYESKIIFHENFVNLHYKSGKVELVSTLPLQDKLPIEKFTELTHNLTREKVFSKWIKAKIEGRVDYQNIKKSASELAAASLVKYVKNNMDPNYLGLKRFLRVHEDSYYYAKSTNAGVKIYKVPSIKDFEKVFLIEDVTYRVPESQINILTTVKNKITGEFLVLRNEIRFSHGQFNGTPEAKMYYDRKSNLETIYEKVF